MRALHNLPVAPIRRRRHILISRIRLDFDPKSRALSARPVLAQEWRFAIVTNVERGMRWTCPVAALRVAQTNDRGTDAEVVWS